MLNNKDYKKYYLWRKFELRKTIETIFEYWVYNNKDNLKGKTFKIPGWLFTILICIVSFCVLTFIFAIMTRLLPYFFLFMLGIMIYRFLRNNL